jgi:hypothetical protein
MYVYKSDYAPVVRFQQSRLVHEIGYLDHDQSEE